MTKQKGRLYNNETTYRNRLHIKAGDLKLKLKNKVAIVTGASKGIGAAIAKELAKEGCNVTINYFSDEKGAKKVQKYIKDKTSQKAMISKADVSNRNDIKNIVNKTVEYFGKIDILINNAGIAIWKPFFDITEEIWDRTIDINLKGTFLTSQLVTKEMIKTCGGVIVNISSLAAHGSMDCLVPYCASKGGMTLLTKAMAVELAPCNIRVNAIAPGTIDIERNRKTDPDYWEPFIPMGRVGKVEDITRLVIFLCSEEASYMTGQNIYICGGQTDYVPMPGSKFARK